METIDRMTGNMLLFCMKFIS